MDFRIVVGLYVTLNIVSVVGIVAVNKILYRDFGLKQPSSLMAFHFLCTWLFVLLAKNLKWYTEKRIAMSQYARLGLAQCCSVIFVNLSLMHNSVGMYQVLKFSNVLMMCVIEFLWKSKSYSLQVYISLITLVVGITAATVTDVELRLVGFFYGMAGCVSTAVYQILNKSIQQDYDVSPLQILEYEQPFTALFAALFALFTEDVGQLLYLDYTTNFVAMLLVSGVFAFGVNVSCYLIIGKTTPITYAVVGHSKTVFILLFGFLWLKEPWRWISGAGLTMAFLGIVAYSHYVQIQPTKKDTREGSDSPVVQVAVSVEGCRTSTSTDNLASHSHDGQQSAKKE